MAQIINSIYFIIKKLKNMCLPIVLLVSYIKQNHTAGIYYTKIPALESWITLNKAESP